MDAFKEKVDNMAHYDIIEAMLEGLRKPVYKINMDTFGYYRNFDQCFGCAATNCISKISGVKFDKHNICFEISRAGAIKTSMAFLSKLELAIDSLRCGDIYDYNREIIDLGGRDKRIPDSLASLELPRITNKNYKNKKVLDKYYQLAKKLKTEYGTYN